MRLSEKTHVYDVANRPWLLPFIADKATGGDRLFLRSIIRQAGAGDPTKRPSFADLVDAIDEFIRRPTNMEESPKERLYASPLIQSNERRRAAASSSVGGSSRSPNKNEVSFEKNEGSTASSALAAAWVRDSRDSEAVASSSGSSRGDSAGESVSFL